LEGGKRELCLCLFDRFFAGNSAVFTLLLLLNNVASGITNVVVASKSQSISPLVLTSASLFTGGVFLFVISIPIEGLPQKAFPAEYFVALA